MKYANLLALAASDTKLGHYYQSSNKLVIIINDMHFLVCGTAQSALMHSGTHSGRPSGLAISMPLHTRVFVFYK